MPIVLFFILKIGIDSRRKCDILWKDFASKQEEHDQSNQKIKYRRTDMTGVRRIFVEKKSQYAVKKAETLDELRNYLGLMDITDIRILNRYDVENISDDIFEKALHTVFSEPPVDNIYIEKFDYTGRIFSVEFLPGQFDQRADSAIQCVKLLGEEKNPIIKTAITYVIQGNITDEEFEAVKKHCINPVDSRDIGMEKPDTLRDNYKEPADIEILDGFISESEDKLKSLHESFNMAMTFNDFLHIRNYFKNEEKRDPSMTEIRVLDTYWSDHCRHTTFSTELKNITFEDGYYRPAIEETYNDYQDNFKVIYKDREDKFVCLMDIALMGMKKLKHDGKLTDQEESDEINACSIVVPVKIDDVTEEWLINFKNETHNHPTEIEPFGGAATCLGGAIRDPLSGRTYVYQAMRITGASDPTVPMSETLEGKLPQKKLVKEAAHGYSSYGNQIGLATGYVKEIYHPNYKAKRMEIGAVMGAAPRKAVRRLDSEPGDRIILLGGRTGRDGIGGATGSSKAHTTKSTEECGAEVQKGNPPTERKIQRLFKREEVSYIIKKCNDFGAGGVSVAIGELALGLMIDLDKVPKKYAGLNGTELAISESQERMAVVVSPKDVDTFLKYAGEENLEAVEVAVVTKEPRMVITWRGKEIVNMSRAFIDTNGAHQETDVRVLMPDEKKCFLKMVSTKSVKEDLEKNDIRTAVLDTVSDLNSASEKGLVEMFDSSIGASTVTMPYGGKYQDTEIQGMVSKLPVGNHICDAVTMMSYGFDPYLSTWSPYHGAQYAVLSSVSKIVAMGGDYKNIHFTFQEYFRRMWDEPERWSQPLAALLGAYRSQLELGLASIGGKDSMSGTFNDIDVPPTLVSFAVDVSDCHNVITPEYKKAGDPIYVFSMKKNKYDEPDYHFDSKAFEKIHDLIEKKYVRSAYSVESKGIIESIVKMGFGNRLGFKLDNNIEIDDLFLPYIGNVVVEVDAQAEAVFIEELKDKSDIYSYVKKIGVVTDDETYMLHDTIVNMEDVISAWEKPLEKVFPTISSKCNEEILTSLYSRKDDVKEKCASIIKGVKPRVFIPVFPGTNCEYDSSKAFEAAGADAEVIVFRNRNDSEIRDSVLAYKKAIADANIVMFPGGFSGGDEPEGSAKFFATAFRNDVIKEEIEKLLNERDGLVLGICNGFQALVKLGLVPYGVIKTQDESAPTLTYNTIGRHISHEVYLRVASNKSPWHMNTVPGEVYVSPASHGEGRFVAGRELLKKLFLNGQVATQYCDPEGNVTMDERWNVNGSYMAVEGITSPDGRVYGKMAHAERRGDHVAINIYGQQDMKIFESGVKYFS